MNIQISNIIIIFTDNLSVIMVIFTIQKFVKEFFYISSEKTLNFENQIIIRIVNYVKNKNVTIINGRYKLLLFCNFTEILLSQRYRYEPQVLDNKIQIILVRLPI